MLADTRMADAVSWSVAAIFYLTTQAMKAATTPTTTLMSALVSIGGYQLLVWELAQVSSCAWHDVRR